MIDIDRLHKTLESLEKGLSLERGFGSTTAKCIQLAQLIVDGYDGNISSYLAVVNDHNQVFSFKQTFISVCEELFVGEDVTLDVYPNYGMCLRIDDLILGTLDVVPHKTDFYSSKFDGVVYDGIVCNR